MPEKQYFLIEKEFAEAILNYLVKRPYIEVTDLIQGLQKLPPVTTVNTTKETSAPADSQPPSV